MSNLERGGGTSDSPLPSGRVLAALLLIGIAAVFCIVVFYESDASCAAGETSGSCGDNLTWSYDSATGALTVSGRGDMDDYSYDDTRWGGNEIKSVTLSFGITHIGSYAFYQCRSLTSVTIPRSVASIGRDAFGYCSALTSVTIPDSVRTIDGHAFEYCYALTSVSFTSLLEYIGDYAFQVCTSLPSVTIPLGVTYLGYSAFAGCTSLASIDVDSLNSNYCSVDGVLYNMAKTKLMQHPSMKESASYALPDSVTSIDMWAFDDCIHLSSITVGGSNTSFCSVDGVLFNKAKTQLYLYPISKAGASYAIPNTVTDIRMYAFSKCTALTNVTMGSSVKDIGTSAFRDCTSLASITLGSSVTSIDSYAFENCSALTSVTIPNSVTSFGNYVFRDCHGLISATVGNSVGSIGYGVFYGCDRLASVTIGRSVTSIGETAFSRCEHLFEVINLSNLDIRKGSSDHGEVALYATNVFTSAGDATVEVIDGFVIGSSEGTNYYLYYVGEDRTNVTFPDIGRDGDCAIWHELFFGNESIVTVTIPDSVTSIGEGSFNRCASLASVTIGSSVTNIEDWAFYECYHLFEVINLSDLDISKRSYDHGYVAYYATNVFTSAGDATVEVVGDYVMGASGGTWYLIESLTENQYVNLERINDRSYAIAKYAFYKDTSIKIFTSGAGSVTSIGDYAFGYCTSMDTFVLGSSVAHIGSGAFVGCTSLSRPYVVDNNPYFAEQDGVIFDEDMTKLILYSLAYPRTSYTVPDSVTTIGEYAFYDCKSITSIYLPESVRYINYLAFNGCNNLANVTVSCTSPLQLVAGSVSNGYVAAYATSITTGHDLTHHYKVNATCTTSGNNAYDTCSRCDYTTYQSIPALGHAYSATYDWADDGSACTVHIVCANNAAHNHDIVNVPSEIAAETPGATCFTMGTTTYSISGTYDGFEYSSTKDVEDIPAGHLYTIVYDWADDGNSCTVHLICERDERHNVDLIYGAAVTVKTPATCTTMGTRTHSISKTYEGLEFYSTKDVQDLPALGHSYSASYDWAEDGSTCTVHITCARDAEHNHDIEDVASQSSVLTPATCYSKGVTRYSVSGTYDGYAFSSTKDVRDIPALGHAYSATYEWAEDGSTCTVSIVCANNGEHNHVIENVESLSSVKTPATCTSEGTTTYSISGTYDGFAYSSTKDVQDIPALGHAYSATYEWAEDGSACTVHIVCANDAEHDHDLEDIASHSSVLNPPTCTVMGTTRYSISGTYDGFSYSSTKDIQDIPVRHAYSATYEWADDGSACTVTLECASCDHTDSFAGNVISSVLTPPTIDAMGVTRYSVSGTYDGFDYSSTKDVQDIPCLIGGSCGENLTWTFDESMGALAITGTGDMSDYSSASNTPWYGYDIRSLSLPEGLTSIGNNAFRGISITSVTIPDTVTVVGYHSFRGCTSLTSVAIPDSVRLLGENMMCGLAFIGCTNLQAISVSAGNKYYTSSNGVLFTKDMTKLMMYPTGKDATSYTIPATVTIIGDEAFYECTHLTSVTIPDGVAFICRYAFQGCTHLTSVILPDSVEHLGMDSFHGCTSLTSVTIPGGVTYFGGDVFEGCTSLTTATLSNGITSVSDGMFYECTSLTSITIPETVTSIDRYAFCKCTSLTSITIPETVTSIGYEAYYECTHLTSVTIPASVTSIGNEAFRGCTSLTTVRYSCASQLTLVKGSTSNGYVACYATSLIPEHVYSAASYDWADDGSACTVTVACVANDHEESFEGNVISSVLTPPTFDAMGVTRYSVSGTYEGFEYSSTKDVEDIPCLIGGSCGENLTWTFDESTGALIISGTGDMTDYDHDDERWGGYTIRSVTLTEGLTRIGDYAFYQCGSLVSLTLPDSLISIGFSAFFLCTSLESVYIPGSATTIDGRAFYCCSSLESITIGSSVTSIGSEVFTECYSLMSITVDGSNTNYCSENGVLFDKAKTRLIQYPASKADTAYAVPGTVTTIGEYAFYSCAHLESVTIPDSVTSINATSFVYSNQLASINVDGANNSYCSENGILFNKGKTTLVSYPIGKPDPSYTIPDSVTRVGSYSFEGCTSLTSVTIPYSVIFIGDRAFSRCTSLTTVRYSCASQLTFEMGSAANGYVARYATSLIVEHDYAASYVWSDDGQSCTVNLACARDHEHDTSFSAQVGSRVKVPATCGSAGTTTYFVSGTYGTLPLYSEKDVQDIPALGHAYSATYEWADDGSTCTVHIVCANDADHNHDIEDLASQSSALTPATCAVAGTTRYSISGTYDGFAYSSTKDVQDIPALGHSYSATYDWADDGSACTVHLTCARDAEHNLDIENIESQSSVLVPATCTTMGTTRYSVSGTYDGFAYSSTKDVQDIPAAHLYSATYDWAADGSSCTVHIVCANDAEHNHDIENIESLSSVLVPATCTTLGTTRYSVSGTYDGFAYSSTKDVQDIPALGHIYSATYDWANDGSACTVHIVCANDVAHNHDIENVASQSIELTPAVCTTMGTTRYSISGTYDGFEYASTKDVQDIPAPGHAYSATYEWADDGSTCTVHIICANDVAHNHDIENVASQSIELTPAVCTTMGTTRYSISGTYDGFEYASTKDVQDIPALGHDYSATYDWANDGSACTVHIVCANDAAHNHDIDASVGIATTVPATCTSAGYTRYYVSGTYDGINYYSTLDVLDAPALGHSYSATYDWADDRSSCTVHIICARNAEHNHDIENIASQSAIKTPATCISPGIITYSISGTYDGFAYSDSRDVEIPRIPPSGSCGTDLVWNFDYETGQLSISGTGAMTDYDNGSSKAPWHEFGITSVSFSEGVTSIGGYAFYGCTSLVSVTIPDSVTSFGMYAFRGCTSLSTVTLPNGITSINDYLFYGCTSLSTVTIPVGITHIGSCVFYECTGLTSISIPNTVSSIGYNAFYGCTALATVRYSCASTLELTLGSESNGCIAYYAESLVVYHDYIDNVTAPTCTEQGYTAHICSMCQDTRIDSYVGPIGHSYSATYDWANDGSACTVHIVCANDAAHNHDIENIESLSSVLTPATCITAGTTRYSVSGTYDGFAYSSTKDVQDIPALGHDYSATYDWANDGSACTVHIVCANDAEHNHDIENIVPQSSVRVPATCTAVGTTTYSVSGTYDGFSYSSTKDIQDIPALGHSYTATYDWADNGSTCTVHVICARDPAHNHDVTEVSASSVKVAPTVGSMGTTTYTISGTYDGFAYSDTRDVKDIPALEPAITQKESGGTTTYANTVTANVATQVTDIFSTAKTNGGSVEVSVPATATGTPMTIEFDGAAVNAIGGNDVSITAKTSTKSSEVAGASLIIEVSLEGATFTQGKAKVTVPLKESVPEGKVMKVYFIDGDKKVDMNASLVDGNVVFETNHFSTYAVFFEDASSGGSEDNGGGFPIIYVVIGVVAVLAIVGGAVALKKRRA